MAVGILLVSGGYLAWKHVGSWTALVGTAYGLTLLAKIVLALPAFGIAAVNLLVIKPRLNNAYEREASEATLTLVRRFGRLVRLETLFALLVLAVAGILTDLQRGADAPLLSDAPGKMVATQTADDVEVQLTIEPALVGPNSFDVYLTDPDGNPVTDATEVSLRYTFLDQSIGAAEGAAVATGNGHYGLDGSYISLIGAWQVEVAVRRPGAFDTFAPFRLEAGLGGNIRPLDTGARPLERTAKFLTLAGGAVTGAFMVLFAVGWGFLAARAARSEWGLTSMLLISILVFWLGATQLFNFFTNEYTPTKFLTNPILPDAASVASGETLFQEHCAVCHGPAGHGDGPVAITLSPPPVDFTAGHTASHPDGDLYYWIRNGIENTAMPAFDDQLSSEETWHLVNYVRRLSVQSAPRVQ
jgi:mono/diheme cytochrome c family protein